LPQRDASKDNFQSQQDLQESSRMLDVRQSYFYIISVKLKKKSWDE
jgi:hypothetical protein